MSEAGRQTEGSVWWFVKVVPGILKYTDTDRQDFPGASRDADVLEVEGRTESMVVVLTGTKCRSYSSTWCWCLCRCGGL